MSNTTDLQEAMPVIPTRVTALSRGRSHLVDTLLMARSRRKRLIRDLEARTQRVLLCYVSEGGSITREDVLHLEALLQRVEPGASVSLLLNSPGGDVDAAEKLLYMLREVVSPPASPQVGDLEIVVPNAAKSAGTLMVLGADRVVMSDTSELGPIDPQVEIQVEGTTLSYPVAAALSAYEAAKRRCQEHPDNPAFRAAFQSFNPILVEQLRLAESRARKLAEGLAKRHGWNHTVIAGRLMDTRSFPSHGQMIDWRGARRIGLDHVQYQPRTDPLRQRYWNLYLALRAVVGDQKKVFESGHVTRLARGLSRSASAAGFGRGATIPS